MPTYEVYDEKKTPTLRASLGLVEGEVKIILTNTENDAPNVIGRLTQFGTLRLVGLSQSWAKKAGIKIDTVDHILLE